MAGRVPAITFAHDITKMQWIFDSLHSSSRRRRCHLADLPVARVQYRMPFVTPQRAIKRKGSCCALRCPPPNLKALAVAADEAVTAKAMTMGAARGGAPDILTSCGIPVIGTMETRPVERPIYSLEEFCSLRLTKERCRGRRFAQRMTRYEFELLAGINSDLIQSPWTKAL
jgi:hypothetical protein